MRAFYKLKSLLIIGLLISLWGVTSIEKAWAIQRPGDMEAKGWMAWPTEVRTVFVMGYLVGVSHSVGVFDYALYSKGQRPFSCNELSDKVYQHLLRNPELRAGPIGPIIWDALKHYLYVAPKGLDKQDK
ncbi:MAG: hypothetical protein P8X65_12955 [Syntrophobacterales bacterium]